ncbi:MAG: molybdopterin-dependent oxidoreductase [Thermodesulfobacteriota bacterium]
MKRRDFLKYIGLGGAGVVLGGVFGNASRPPGAKLIPYLIPPDDIIPGVGAWYSSLCTQCPAGCGTVVKVMEGRAKKVEGNPLHPVNKGKLCARGQAGLQALYNPDRIKAPMKRVGTRGGGKASDFEEISWDSAIKILSANLKDLVDKGDARRVYLHTNTVRGHLDRLFGGFMERLGSPNYRQYELYDYRNLRHANKTAFGIEAIPHYDIANASFVLSFGADFNSTWLSPVNYGNAYGQMRQGRGERGRLVQVEPRMSLTGANADEWVPVAPGAEGIFALSMAYAIIEAGLYTAGDAGKWKKALAGFEPSSTAKSTDVKAEKTVRLAKEFAGAPRGLAIGGETLAGYDNGVSSILAVNVLNHLGGKSGGKGGIIPNPDDLFFTGHRQEKDQSKGLAHLVKDIDSSKVKALLLHNTNPLFTTSPELGLELALKKVPFICSMTSFMDETSAVADLILPLNTSFEDWGDDFTDPGVGGPVATLMQPVVSPVFKTKGAGDIFIELAKELGGKLAEDHYHDDYHEYLRESWRKIYENNKEISRGSLTFDSFWNTLLQKGGWWKTGEPKAKVKKTLSVSPGKVSAGLSGKLAAFAGDKSEYPLHLLLYPQAGLLDGRGANLPWLQELPDPITTVVWGSWVEMNPVTAKKHEFVEGDKVKIISPFGSVKAFVFLYPGIRPDTVAMPIGQGHKLYGRYAEGRGVNPIEIIPAVVNNDSGAMALNCTRVKVEPSGGSGRLVKIEPTAKESGPPSDRGRPIVQTITSREYKRLKKETI